MEYVSLGDPQNPRTWSGTPKRIFDALRTEHDVDWLCPTGVRTFDEGADSVQRRAYESSDQVIFSSKWAADSGIKVYDIPQEKANVIHFGANVAVPPEDVAEESRRISRCFSSQGLEEEGRRARPEDPGRSGKERY